MDILLIVLIITIVLIVIIVLICKLFHNKFNYFNNKKFYFEIDNFLTQEECDTIIKKNNNNTLFRSKVLEQDKNTKNKETESKVRTSTQAWLNDNEYIEVNNKILNLVNKYSSHKMTLNYGEEIQFVKYLPNQKYEYHYDICHPNTCALEHRKSCKMDYEEKGSVRYVTVIIYLNDNFTGGETEFTRLGLKIRPKTGKALLFFNGILNKDSFKNGLCDVIEDSQHAGTTVQSGEKFMMNKWFRVKAIK